MKDYKVEFRMFPSRLTSGSDSLVGVGAFAKGRSPSFKLNSVLRSAMPFSILFGGKNQQVNFKVATQRNPSDDLSICVSQST